MSDLSFDLHDRVAVVTGASRGIGRSVAEALAGAGAHLALLGRDQGALAEAARTLGNHGSRAIHLVADVNDAKAVDAAFSAVKAEFGQLDILVNNAGVEQLCPSLQVDEALWDRIVGTNLKGAFFCAQRAARLMKGGGSIVNLCSLTSEVGVPGAAPYGASKSGLAGLTRTLAAEAQAALRRLAG